MILKYIRHLKKFSHMPDQMADIQHQLNSMFSAHGSSDARGVFEAHVLPDQYGHQIEKINAQMIKNRNTVINVFLKKGVGIEIGALHNPTPLGDDLKVYYVDYMSGEDLRKRYKELGNAEIKEPDIIDDAEKLSKVSRNDYDFVIANHFIEHCQNPILTIKNMLSKVKNAGYVILSIPDKRYTFDVKRSITEFTHLIKDYEEGPEWSHRGHYEDFAAATCHINNRTAEEQFAYYFNNVADIHFHVWDYYAFFNFLEAIKKRYSFPLEVICFMRNGFENICVIQKQENST